MKQKDARILWNEEKNQLGQYEITEFIIAECTKENGYERRFNRYYHKSWGNCNAGWEDIKAIDVLVYFFRDRFKSWELGTKFLDELTKIEEFREDMKLWIQSMPKEDENY